jgi:hypothetical protein
MQPFIGKSGAEQYYAIKEDCRPQKNTAVEFWKSVRWHLQLRQQWCFRTASEGFRRELVNAKLQHSDESWVDSSSNAPSRLSRCSPRLLKFADEARQAVALTGFSEYAWTSLG